MIVVMKADASQEDLDAVKRRIVEEGLRPSVVEGAERNIVGVLGTITRDHESAFEGMNGVLQILRVSRPYKLASREFHPADTVVEVGGVKIGGGDLAVMAGPCSVESEEQVVDTARAVKAAGGNILRGGAFKPRTSPYSFPRPRRRGAPIPRQGAGRDGPPRDHRGHDHRGLARRLRVRRHRADRRPQHAELQPP